MSLCSVMTLKCLTFNDLEMPFYAKKMFSLSVSLFLWPRYLGQLCENERNTPTLSPTKVFAQGL